MTCNSVAKWDGGPLPATNICYVTVDTASKYNEVLWDKTGVDTNLVDSFQIYRKGVLGFQYIGHVSVHDYTQFIDSGSQPNTISTSYEICTVDTSGLISQLTPYHQTILLQANVGVGNTVNLSWNPYVGDSVNYYVILRDSTGLGNWQRLDSVPNNIFAFIDNYPPVSHDLRYVINTAWNLHCIPYSHAPITHQAMNVNDVTSSSNRKQLTTTGIQTINPPILVNVYPNPAKDVIYIALSEPSEVMITLCDILGRDIYFNKITNNETIKQLNLSGIKPGVYFLKLDMNDGSVLVKKIEIMK